MRRSLLIISTLVILILCGSAGATTWYLSPTGTNGANGTDPSTPKQTFAHIFTLLDPGDTLILLNGTYTSGNSGMMINNCTSGAPSGTSTAPITIRAQNERAARISSTGSSSAILLTGCAWWVLEGIYASGADLASGSGGCQCDVINIASSNHITLRRMLASHNNRYFNDHTYEIASSADVLIEESEAYFFHRHGFSIWKSERVTLRRIYANGRAYPDIPVEDGGSPSGTNNLGEEAVALYQTSDSIIENSISESSIGMEVHGGTTFTGANGGEGNLLLGNMSLGDHFCLKVDSRSNGVARDNIVEHMACANSLNDGMQGRAAENLIIDHATVFNAGSRGGMFDRGALDCGPLVCSHTIRNSVIWSAGGFGLNRTDQDSWLVEWSNSAANASTAYNDAEDTATLRADAIGNIRNSLSVTPTDMGLGAGQCMAWVPSTSNMSGAGLGDSDIGATILYRYQDGLLSGTPLWDTTTGAFPCGATVTGLNTDVAGFSCVNFHTRFNINTNGCSFPAGYASATLPEVTIAANDTAASEVGPDNGQFTITRTGSTAGALTVFFTMGGVATQGTDYTSGSTTQRTIADGQSTQTMTIAPITDAIVEVGGETVSVQLVSDPGYTLGTPDNAELTIADSTVLSYSRVLSGMIAK